MVTTGKGWNAASGIALAKALVAGGVMALNLNGGQNDDKGAAIDSEWVPVDTALFAGEDTAAPDALGNIANPDKIANPDNLKFSEKLRTLFIGEDSGQHVNNFLWAYNVDTKLLSRVMSMPSGAEATGLHVVDDTQRLDLHHEQLPARRRLERHLHGKVKATLDPLVRRQLQGPLRCGRGLPDGRANQRQADEGLKPGATRSFRSEAWRGNAPAECWRVANVKPRRPTACTGKTGSAEECPRTGQRPVQEDADAFVE